MANRTRATGRGDEAEAPRSDAADRRCWPRRPDVIAWAAIFALALSVVMQPSVHAAAPQILAASAKTGGQIVLLTFDQGVYANNDATGALTTAHVALVDASASGVSVAAVQHTAGSSFAALQLSAAEAEPGADTVDVDAAVYNAGGEQLNSGSPVTVAADNTAPALMTAVVQDAAPGNLVATFSEPLFAANATGFTVLVNAAANTITGVTATGTNVLSFVLTTAVASGDNVTLAYDGSGTAADLVGNAAAAFTAAAVTNNVAASDSTAPVLMMASINGVTLTLVYGEPLDGTSVPATDAFVVQIQSTTVAVTNVGVTGSTVALTVATPAVAGDVVTVSYTAGASPIQDAAGNDAAALTNQAVTNATAGGGGGTSFPFCSADDTVSCVQSLSVSDASTLPTASVSLGAGLVQVGLKNGSASDELATLGATASTVYTLVLKLRGYTPRLLLGGGRDVSFTIDDTPQPDHTLVTIVAKPITADQIQPAPSIASWPTGSADVTNTHFTRMVSLAIADLTGFSSSQQALLKGTALVTDAQAFTQPTYHATTKVLSLSIAGPHFLSDGTTAHFGFFEAHLPQALLSDWGVSQPSDITAVYTEGSSGLAVTTESGGLRVDFAVSFSSGTVSLQQASSNANLSALTLSAGTLTPVFASGTTSYIASVGNATSSINVTATLAGTSATFTTAGSAAVSGVPKAVALSTGANVITVAVTAQDATTTKSYAVTVTRAAAPAGDSGSGDSSSGGGGNSGGNNGGTTAGAPPAAGSGLPGGVELGAPVVSKLLRPATDGVKDASGKGTVLQAASEDGKVKATIPVNALKSRATTAIELNIRPVADVRALETAAAPPRGAVIVAGQAFQITANDDDGSAIREFDERIQFEFIVDPELQDVRTIAVFFYNDLTGAWVQVPASVSTNGTVRFATDHLTLYALFTLPTVEQRLVGGLNAVAFTGASDTAVAAVADALGPTVVSISRFNPLTQSFDVYVPGSPPGVSRLDRLSEGESLFVRLRPRSVVTWSQTDASLAADAPRRVPLLSGVNAVSYTGGEPQSVASLLAPIAGVVESASRFDATSQRWAVYLPGAPSRVNSWGTVHRLDVLFIRVDRMSSVSMPASASR